jgi:hypothetical protein
VKDPAPGPWIIEILGAEIVEDGNPATPEIDAVYSLVVSGDTSLSPCYPDCNADGALDITDFGCFTNSFINGGLYSDCNNDGVRDITDFACFANRFIVGCP